MKIKIKLAALLDQRGVSHREFARQTGIRHPTISEMCNNQIKHIPLDNLAKICESLGCQLTDVLELESDEN